MLDIPSSGKSLEPSQYKENIFKLREMHVIGVHDFGTFMANFGVNSIQRKAFTLAFYRYLGCLHSVDGCQDSSNKGHVIAGMVAVGDFLSYEVQLFLNEGYGDDNVVINIVHVNDDDTTTLVVSLRTCLRYNSQDVLTLWNDGGASLEVIKGI